jgi:hypothetical protein
MHGFTARTDADRPPFKEPVGPSHERLLRRLRLPNLVDNKVAVRRDRGGVVQHRGGPVARASASWILSAAAVRRRG